MKSFISRYVAGEYVRRLRNSVKKRLEKAIIQSERTTSDADATTKEELMLDCLASITVGSHYQSEDPVSLMDIECREYGQLMRVSDDAATMFYHIHSAVKCYFSKSHVTRNTPRTAESNVKKSPSLLQRVKSLFDKHPADIVTGMLLPYFMKK